MSDQALHCNDYVNQPYPLVRDTLLANPHDVFRRATAAAAIHAATLHVRFGGIDIGTEVEIQITGVAHDHAYDQPATRISLEWQATSHPRIFPLMKATFLIFALSTTETQLELRGVYQPPMGKLGELIDDAVGHRLAAASVNRFIREVAAWLREELAVAGPAPTIVEPAPPPDAVVDSEC